MDGTCQDYNVEIGTNAGILWEALNKGGPQMLSAISRTTRVPEARLREALGWLAREGKIAVEAAKKDAKVSLIGNA